MKPFTASIGLAFVALLANVAGAQCFEWKGGFGLDGVDGDIRASLVFDDGTGTAVYVGGSFTSAGGVPAQHVARWNGVAWSAVANGLPGIVRCLSVYDDGSGPKLHAATTTPHGVWKLDGSHWTHLPNSDTGLGGIAAMAVHDDGTGHGSELYIAGFFDGVGGVLSPSVARWDGTQWSAVGSGLTGSGFSFQASDLAVFDGGSGPEIYCVGLLFGGIAKWDGVSWTYPVSNGGGINGSASALAVYDDGAGTQLYVTGSFTTAGGVSVNGLARWNGQTWSDVGGGLPNASIGRMTVFDDGSGSKLYCSSKLPGSFGAYRIATWDGASWNLLPGSASNAAYALTPFQDTHGTALFVGGAFTSVDGQVVHRAARFDGSGWQPIGVSGQGISRSVWDMRVFDGGSGPRLFVGGSFMSAGAARARGIAMWDGSSWSALDNTPVPDDPYAISVGALGDFDDGSGRALYFSDSPFGGGHVRRWDGATVTTVGGSANGSIFDFEVFDDGSGPALYAAGTFTQIAGAPIARVAKWSGANWVGVGSGITTSTGGGTVNALAVHDDGTGPALYAAGDFVATGISAARNIVKWDGVSWMPVGTGIDSRVLDLAVFDDGNGPQLFACGWFTHAGSTTTNGIARWDGSDWFAVGGGVDGCATEFCQPVVYGFGVFDDGSGDALYVGGEFLRAGGVDAPGVARWNGNTWSALGLGLDALTNVSVTGFASYDDGQGLGPALYVAGTFARAGEWPSSNIAKWAPCGVSPGNGFCFGDGSLATSCPCAPPNVVPSPSGTGGAGCANSFHLGGARLTSSGSTSSDTVSLRASDLPPSALTIFVAGSSSHAVGIPIGDGVRCADGTLVRFGTQHASNGVARYPFAALGHILPLSTVSGFVAGGGARAHYQALYRNPAAGFCSAGTVNLTNAQQIDW